MTPHKTYPSEPPHEEGDRVCLTGQRHNREDYITIIPLKERGRMRFRWIPKDNTPTE